MCNIEFPHFGASYPDAHCIYGYLWDMDSYEDGYYTIGGEDPCPFCNTEEWLKTVLDNGEFASREEALEWVEKMREKWGAEHFADEHKMKELGKKEGRTDCSPQGEVPNGNLATQSYENIPNDIEEAAEKCIDDALFKWSYDDEDGIEQYVHDAFIAGAKWQKEQDNNFERYKDYTDKALILLNINNLRKQGRGRKVDFKKAFECCRFALRRLQTHLLNR